ncbi:MAG: alpha/beta hydrolase family protein [Gemmataceae bacterium]
MRRLLAAALFLSFASPVLAQDADPRLGKPKDYNGYFPWTPPKDLKSWEERRPEVRTQVLVANGLWPMWDKAPLKPVIHGKIERDGYTIEKVSFASLPGHYVTGNLYRPTGKTGKLPGVLCPHGHWANGRFYENGDKGIAAEIKSGAEKTPEGAKYPLQARCAQLARLGCVVFHYDMVGYADSKAIAHRTGFMDADAELRLQNFMGLQTFNSIRCLDFLMGLPDVDTSRIGVTGASGGGTQTFILCAVDDRPSAAFPAVMVGTAMQGGCSCENCSYLRIGTGNIELAGMMAPRPLGMSAANDWTVDIETKGLPELKALYKLYGKEDLVQAKCWKEFGHNYNQVARESMYNFFARHLKLDVSTPIVEKPFVPVPPKELSVYDDKHPRPADEANAERLRATLTEMNSKQLDALFPADAKKLAAMRAVLAPALGVLLGAERTFDVEKRDDTTEKIPDGTRRTVHLRRMATGETVRVTQILPADFDGRLVVLVDPTFAGSSPEATAILKKKSGVLAVEVLRTGLTADAPRTPVNKGFAGYTFAYNRPLLAERVRDIQTAVAWARTQKDVKEVDLLGVGRGGVWVALARPILGPSVRRAAADLNGFNFGSIKTADDENMLPGALKYGGLLTMVSLAAPHEILVYNTEGCGAPRWLEAAYKAAGAPDKLTINPGAAKDAVAWLLR